MLTLAQIHFNDELTSFCDNCNWLGCISFLVIFNLPFSGETWGSLYVINWLYLSYFIPQWLSKNLIPPQALIGQSVFCAKKPQTKPWSPQKTYREAILTTEQAIIPWETKFCDFMKDSANNDRHHVWGEWNCINVQETECEVAQDLL